MRFIHQIDLMGRGEATDAIPDPVDQITDAHLFGNITWIVQSGQSFVETLAKIQIVERFTFLFVGRAFRMAEDDTFQLFDQQIEFHLPHVDQRTRRWACLSTCGCLKTLGQVQCRDQSCSTDEKCIGLITYFTWGDKGSTSIDRS